MAFPDGPPSVPLARSGRPAEEVAREVVHRAGTTIRAAFRSSVLRVESKGRGNLVTNVDLQVEREARDALRGEFPTFGLLAEESAEERGESPFTWILDPLDGTRNFATGVPFFSVTLALTCGDAVLLALTHDPLRGDLFRAAPGQPMTVNGERRQVTRNTAIAQGNVGFDLPYKDALVHRSFEVVQALWPVQTVRILGSAALGLAYAAAGWVDLYFHLSLQPWDTAAGLLLVREAGGVVTDARGVPATPFGGSFVASSAGLVGEFLERTADLHSS